MLQPKKPVVKKTTKKSNNPADSYPANKDNRGVPTIGGGEGKRPPFDKNSPVLPLPGRKAKNMPKAKNGKSFPDLNKDGKVTKADILKGRGVIAKSGTTIKKAQNGTVTPYEKSVKTSKQVGVRGNDLFRVDSAGKVLEKATNPKQKLALKSKQTKDSTSTMNSRNRMADSANKISISNTIKKIGSRGLKSGGSVKKCKYGCK